MTNFLSCPWHLPSISCTLVLSGVLTITFLYSYSITVQPFHSLRFLQHCGVLRHFVFLFRWMGTCQKLNLRKNTCLSGKSHRKHHCKQECTLHNSIRMYFRESHFLLIILLFKCKTVDTCSKVFCVE